MSVSPRQREIELTSGMGLGDYVQSRPTTQRAQELAGPIPTSPGDFLHTLARVAPAFGNPTGMVGRNIATYGVELARSLKERGIEATMKLIIHDLTAEVKQSFIQTKDFTFDTAAIDQEIGRAATGALAYSASFLPGNDPELVDRVRAAWADTPGGLFQKGRAANEAYASGNERLAGLANMALGPSSLLTAAGKAVGGAAKVGEATRAAELTGIAASAGMDATQAAAYGAKRAAVLSAKTPLAQTARGLSAAGDLLNQAEMLVFKPVTQPLGQLTQRGLRAGAPRVEAAVGALTKKYGGTGSRQVALGTNALVKPKALGLAQAILNTPARSPESFGLGSSVPELARLSSTEDDPARAVAAKLVNESLDAAELASLDPKVVARARSIIQSVAGKSVLPALPTWLDLAASVERIKTDPRVADLNMQNWYEETWGVLQPIFGDETELFMHLLALASGDTTVAANVTFALKAYAQYKTGGIDAIGGLRNAAMNAEAKQLFRKWQAGGGFNGVQGAGVDVSYRKRTQFVNSFKEGYLRWLGQRDPEALQTLLVTQPQWRQYMQSVSATPDRWEARAWGVTTKPTPEQFDLIRLQLMDAANILGYTPRELQAMHWGDIQLRWVEKAGNIEPHLIPDADIKSSADWLPEKVAGLDQKGAYEAFVLRKITGPDGRVLEDWPQRILAGADAARAKALQSAIRAQDTATKAVLATTEPADVTSFDVPFKRSLSSIVARDGSKKTGLDALRDQGLRVEELWSGEKKKVGQPTQVVRFFANEGETPEALVERVRNSLRAFLPSNQSDAQKALWGTLNAGAVYFPEDVAHYGRFSEPDRYTGVAASGYTTYRPLGVINDPHGLLDPATTMIRNPVVRGLDGAVRQYQRWSDPAAALPSRQALPNRVEEGWTSYTQPTEPFESGDWRSGMSQSDQDRYTAGLAEQIQPIVQRFFQGLNLPVKIGKIGAGIYGGGVHDFIPTVVAVDDRLGRDEQLPGIMSAFAAALGKAWGQADAMWSRPLSDAEMLALPGTVREKTALAIDLTLDDVHAFANALTDLGNGAEQLGAMQLPNGQYRVVNRSPLGMNGFIEAVRTARQQTNNADNPWTLLQVSYDYISQEKYDDTIAKVATSPGRSLRSQSRSASGNTGGAGDTIFARVADQLRQAREDYDRTFLAGRPVSGDTLGGLSGDTLGAVSRPRLALNRPGFIGDPELRAANLREWGGANILAREDGAPLTFYHGTDANFNRFTKASRGKSTGKPDALHATFFTNDPEWAGFFANYARGTSEAVGRESAPQVYPVHLRAHKLLYYVDPGVNVLLADDALAVAKSYGYDGIAILNDYPAGATTSADLPGQVMGRLREPFTGEAVPVFALKPGDGPPPFTGDREVVALLDTVNVKSATGNLGTYDPSAYLDKLSPQPDTLAIQQQGQNPVEWLRTQVLSGLPVPGAGSRAAVMGSTGLIGGAVGAALPTDTAEERRQNAISGFGVGAGVAGAMTSARGYNLLRNAPQIERFAKNLLGEMVAAQKAAQARPDQGIASLKTLTAVWKVQATSTLRNILQDETTARLWLSDAGVRTQLMNDNWASLVDLYNRGIRDGYEALPAEMTAILDGLRPGEKYIPDIGMSFAQANQGAVDALTGKTLVERLSAADLAKAQAALSLLSPAQGGIPIVGLLTSGAFGYYRPAQQTLFETLNNFTRVASRGAAWEEAINRTLPQAASNFLDRLAAQGADVSALVSRQGLFSPDEVEALLPGAGASWRMVSDKVIQQAEAFAKDMLGDYTEKLPGERAISSVVPFVSYALRAVPRTAKLMIHHPGASLVILLTAVKGADWAKQQGLPGYLGASIPISTDTPVLGGVVRAMAGGQEGTGYLQPLQLLSPVGGSLLSSEDLPADATPYQQARNALGRVGFSPAPLIGALAYATNQDYQMPGNLSRLGGIEAVAPGPEVPSLTQGPLNFVRTQAGGYPQETTALDRRIAQVFYRATGLALSDPAVRDNPLAAALANSTLDPDSPLVQQALREERESQIARQAVSFHSPVSLTVRTDVQGVQDRARAAQSIMPPANVDPALIAALDRQGGLGSYVQARNYEQANLGTRGEPLPAAHITSRASGRDRAQQALERWQWANRAARFHDPAGYTAAEQQMRQLLGLP